MKDTVECIEDISIEEAVNIVDKWSNEHPRKTMLQHFIKEHPKARFENGIPLVCPFQLGYTDEDKCYFYRDCKKCWNGFMYD